MWEVPSKNNPKMMTHVELILQGSKGDRLHVVLPRSLLKRWGGVLGEFKTLVTPVDNPPFPLEALRLRSIGDILHAERINEDEMFNVVALVVGRGDPREMENKTLKIFEKAWYCG
ncbi:hypothetical protein PIB30_061764 [Stylosanthes scabra]|uniref:Uncharacterized protein n=1 Tax=Stylosanthes scabra TaxID=79078 RepID=A0ABU6XL29_9FABA|nr:hypothetical protein [Stylosanthes scabra]